MASNVVTAEDVKAKAEAELQAALDAARAMPRDQLAEPLYWWEIYALGPVQFGPLVPPGTFLDRDLQPGRIIRLGESAFLVSVLLLNPFPLPQDPGIIPCDFLTPFQLPYRIEYHTINVDNLTSLGTVVHEGYLYPGQCYYVDVLEITPSDPGCIFETNICARILDCHKSTPSASPFAGFARSIINLDPELFLPTTFLEFDNPVRYMVYE